MAVYLPDGARHQVTADPKSIANLSTQVLCNADHRLIRVYDNTIHHNDGCHLTGGVANYKLWQHQFDTATASPYLLYIPPQGKIGDNIVAAYAAELRSARNHR